MCWSSAVAVAVDQMAAVAVVPVDILRNLTFICLLLLKRSSWVRVVPV
jgi:hypothetical protein